MTEHITKKRACTSCLGTGGFLYDNGDVQQCDDCEGTGIPVETVWVQDPHIRECLIAVKVTDLR